jgi:hypothetical protein
MEPKARNPAALLAAVAVLWARAATAQTENDPRAAAADVPPPSPEEEKEAEKEDIEWSFSASVLGYLVPDDRDFAQPTFTADRDWLHIEARYNYEELQTGSAWVGVNFSFGEELTFDFTPMVGGVFGDLNGVAPGYKATLSWWKLELYSEGEYVIDVDDHEGNFFYTWSELSLAPVDWFRFGIVAQRTRAYETDLEVQRGFLVGFSLEPVDFTAYVLNLGWDDPTFVLSLGIGF